MSFAAAARVHPLETYALVLNMLPLFALGFPVDALLPLAPLSIGYALLIHSKLPFDSRRFVYLINSPAYHHWHHSRKCRGNGTNFAGYFPIFDVLFGSYYFPKRAPEEVGIEDPNMPQSYWAQLLYPFQRTHEPHEPHERTDEVQLQGSNQAAQ
jgi:sterol desaturase/sphingolipid hydroxylase (fatty acid hydroxylase superfamily)